MSNQETIKGRLVAIPREKDESLEDFAKRVSNEELDTEWYDTYFEQLSSSDKYFIVGNTIYEITKQTNLEDYDYCDIEDLGNGEFSFITSFYNGGTYLTEMLQEELSK